MVGDFEDSGSMNTDITPGYPGLINQEAALTTLLNIRLKHRWSDHRNPAHFLVRGAG